MDYSVPSLAILVSAVLILRADHRRNVRGVPVPPTFWTGGTVPPTFQDTGEEFAVVRGNLWRSNYTKTVFGRGSAPDPITGELLSCVVFQV